MAKNAAPKKRRLGDLFQVGKDISIDDGSGDPIELYMRRPNPFEHEEALREGNAARARVALKMRDPKTEENTILESDLAALANKFQLAEFLLTEDQQEVFTRAYQSVANDEKWSEDGLLDAVQDNLEKWDEEGITEESDDWEDYQRAKEKLEEFNEEVFQKTQALREERRMKLLEDEDGELREKVRKVLIDRTAGLAFFRDYRIACLFYAVREADNHGNRYFLNKQEVRELPYEIQQQLLEEYDAIDLSRDEAKNSLSAAPSSSGSAQSESPEASSPSGPEESND